MQRKNITKKPQREPNKKSTVLLSVCACVVFFYLSFVSFLSKKIVCNYFLFHISSLSPKENFVLPRSHVFGQILTLC